MTALLLPFASITPSHASGPGVHVFEAVQTLDSLAAEDPEWAALALEPMAYDYVALGSIAPDLQWALDELTFGHSRSLSLALLDSVGPDDNPYFKLFALGHLAHIASDASAEGFIAPAMVSSAPLGMIDLFPGHEDGPMGEQESLFEHFGDLILGDWDSVIDLLFDFFMDGAPAKTRLREIFGWYCETGAPLAGRPDTDCALALHQLEELLGLAHQYLGHFDREGAKTFLRSMIDRPPRQVLPLWAAGFVTQYLGIEGAASDPRELKRLQESAVATEEYWAAYHDGLWALGPAFTLDFLFERPDASWPDWNPNAMIAGNILSVMQFLPGEYSVVPGLLVDRLFYTDANGARITEVAGATGAADLNAHVRFFSVYPLSGTVTGVVRRDHPGFSQENDEEVGRASLAVDIDPLDYGVVPRSELKIPFTADPAGVLGFYVELYFDDDPLPTFTSSWDRLWTIAELPLEKGIYQDNFATYGRFPPSLPVADPDSREGALFAKVHVAPDGPPIAGAEVMLMKDGDEPALDFPEESAARSLPIGGAAGASLRLTAANGLAVFDMVPPEIPLVVTAQAVDHALEPPEEIVIDVRSRAVVSFALHALAAPRLAPFTPTNDCLNLTFAAERFEYQVREFFGQAFLEDTATPISERLPLGTSGEARLCFDAPQPDGALVYVTVEPRYRDGTHGVADRSETTVIDGAAPSVEEIVLHQAPEYPCLEDPSVIPYLPPTTVEVEVGELHSPVVSVAYRLGEGDWDSAPEPALSFSLPGGGPVVSPLHLELWLTSAAGHETYTQPLPIPLYGEEMLCPPPGPGDDVDDVAGPAPSSGGCAHTESATGGAASGALVLSLLMVGVLLRRAR